jgi:hypothetical protein
MTDDIVAELDGWLAVTDDKYEWLIDQETVKRARDEIVALREGQYVASLEQEIVGLRELVAAEVDRSQEFADGIRAEALEEAARVVEDRVRPEDATEITAAIRALKEKA